MDFKDSSWGEFEMRPTLITHYRDNQKHYLYTTVTYHKYEKVTRYYESGKHYTLWRKLIKESRKIQLNIFNDTIENLPLTENDNVALLSSMKEDYDKHKDCEHGTIQTFKYKDNINVKVEYLLGKRKTPIGESKPLF
jgi:hypothetical protein